MYLPTAHGIGINHIPFITGDSNAGKSFATGKSAMEQTKKLMQQPQHSHPVFGFIYMVITIATGVTGTHILYDHLHDSLAIVLQLCSLLMFVGWGVLHWEKIRFQLRAWIIKNKSK
jgi:hypothetical protein